MINLPKNQSVAKQECDPLPKLDFETIISEYTVNSLPDFINYLYYVWIDLAYRNDETSSKGISKLVFSQVIFYYNRCLVLYTPWNYF